ncbi:MAG: acetyl-CoA carboxylase biotin carboxyl carrier protein subunit [Alphaproteobacteria bacterium]
MAEVAVKSEINGKVWKIEAGAGATVAEEDTILILESMKMEIPVTAPQAGAVQRIVVAEGDTVEEDQVVAYMEV